MTKAQLQQYRSLVLEIDILQKRIDKLEHTEQEVQHAFVRGSNPEFPFEPKSFHVSGYNIVADFSRRHKIDQLKSRLTKKRDECQEELLRITEYINGIKNSTDRIIFTKAFIDGLILDEIGRFVHMDRSTVGKRINKYLE